MLFDIREIQDKAKKELAEEITKDAIEKLKELYTKKNKAELIVKNIDREINGYVASIEENSIYSSAGVDTAAPTKG